MNDDEEAPAHRSPAPAHRGSHGRRRRRGGWLRETGIVVLSALLLSILIKTFLAQAFYIPSGSMRDTLEVGDRVLVSKLTPGPLDVHRGDVVVFVDPDGWLEHEETEESSGIKAAVTKALTFIGLLPQHVGEHLIKRAIGVGGDEVVCCDEEGRISVNGDVIDEPYLRPGEEPSLVEFEVTVPDDHLWLMGDNRSNSQDSRSHQGNPGGGAVPLDNVVGTAVAILWPTESWSVLRNPGATFEDVPDPA